MFLIKTKPENITADHFVKIREVEKRDGWILLVVTFIVAGKKTWVTTGGLGVDLPSPEFQKFFL